jgi:inner membrane protein
MDLQGDNQLPSPIAHSFIGYLIYRTFRGRLKLGSLKKIGPFPFLLLLAVFFTMLPDLDSVLGILAGDFSRYHNQGSHSLVTGLIVALISGLVIWIIQKKDFFKWFLFILVSYEMHIVMDFFTVGRGVMLFWPISEERFISPVLLFFGVRWSEGLIHVYHVITLVTELAFILIAFLLLIRFEKGNVVFRKRNVKKERGLSAE